LPFRGTTRFAGLLPGRSYEIHALPRGVLLCSDTRLPGDAPTMCPRPFTGRPLLYAQWPWGGPVPRHYSVIFIMVSYPHASCQDQAGDKARLLRYGSGFILSVEVLRFR